MSSGAINNELPFLQRIAQLNPNSVTLDFGCGLGRLAAAFAQLGPAVGRYFGYEPESVAQKWLVQAYKKDQRFFFGGVDLLKEVKAFEDAIINGKNVLEMNMTGLKSQQHKDSAIEELHALQHQCRRLIHCFVQVETLGKQI